MDSFDDFEFKPLTEGLGFNKKPDKKSEKTTVAKKSKTARRSAVSAPVSMNVTLDSSAESELLGRESKSISDLIASLPPSLDFVERKEDRKITMPDIEPNLNTPDGGRPQIFQPFAREDFKTSSTPTKAAMPAPTVGSAMAAAGSLSGKMPIPGSKALPTPTASSGVAAKVPSAYRERLNESFARAFPHAERKAAAKANAKATATLNKVHSTEGLEPIPAHLGAGFLDGMVVTGMSSILLVAIVGITHVNLYGLLTNVRTDGPTQVHIALLGLACLQLYFLTARSFFGASLGEWAFDLQLGSADDQRSAVYPLQVAWRTIVVTLTGLVLLPLLSLIFRRDLAKYVTGVQLYFRRP